MMTFSKKYPPFLSEKHNYEVGSFHGFTNWNSLETSYFLEIGLICLLFWRQIALQLAAQ
jgi:hypothetical protein